MLDATKFNWGRIVTVHRIGPYEIVESIRKTTDETEFHPYVNGHSTRHCYGTLDEALAGAITARIAGMNCYYDRMFIDGLRALGDGRTEKNVFAGYADE